MKIYTKTGDKGDTALYDGSRHPKSELVFELLGEIDELSSRIGVAITSMPPCRAVCSVFLRFLQVCLQDLNSLIATPKTSRKKLEPFSPSQTQILEHHIDLLQTTLPKLTIFILPGIDTVDSHLQLCRTQTRKVERLLWRHIKTAKSMKSLYLCSNVTQFINRLSDFFFVLARVFQTKVDISA